MEGLATDDHPLTAVLAHRCDPYAAPLPVEVDSSPDPEVVGAFAETTLDRQNDLVTAADEVNARVEAWLDMHEAEVRRTAVAGR